MLKAFDCYLDEHARLRVFAEDAGAAKVEYFRLYGFKRAAQEFHAVEADPNTEPPVEEPKWTARRQLIGTLGTERKLTDEPRVAAPQPPKQDAPKPEVPTPEVPKAPEKPAVKPAEPPASK